MAGVCKISWTGSAIVLVVSYLFGCSLAGRSVQLGNNNWERMLEGEWLVKFYAPWCPACQNVAPIWSKLALKAEQLGINVGDVDSTKEAGVSGRFMIVSLPTIYHIKDGVFRKYEGPRSLDRFMDFINEQKWRNIEPVPWWRSPGSYLMGCVSMMFRFSMLLKDLHELLTITYGLPTWASYTIFGVTTVVTGLLLGAGIVFVSDYVLGVPTGHFSAARAPPVKEESTDKPGEEEGEEEEEKSEEKQENDNDNSGVRKRATATTD